MGVIVEGVEELMWRLRQGGQRAVKGAINQMREEALDIRDLAREMAPVDEGDLERSIKVREEGGGRGEGGRFTQKTLVIEIDGDVPAGKNKLGETVTVGDYAYIMHEYLTPFGRYGLGPRSQAKQDGSNVLVGGKFLERAVAQQSQGLVNRIVEAVREEMDGWDE